MKNARDIVVSFVHGRAFKRERVAGGTAPLHYCLTKMELERLVEIAQSDATALDELAPKFGGDPGGPYYGDWSG